MAAFFVGSIRAPLTGIVLISEMTGGYDSVYVTAPQHIPALLNQLAGNTGSGSNGVGVWASHDGGQTFPINANVGSTNGGGRATRRLAR